MKKEKKKIILGVAVVAIILLAVFISYKISYNNKIKALNQETYLWLECLTKCQIALNSEGFILEPNCPKNCSQYLKSDVDQKFLDSSKGKLLIDDEKVLECKNLAEADAEQGIITYIECLKKALPVLKEKYL